MTSLSTRSRGHVTCRFNPEEYDDSVYTRPVLPKEKEYQDFLAAVLEELRSKVDKRGILWDCRAVKGLPLQGVDGVAVVDSEAPPRPCPAPSQFACRRETCIYDNDQRMEFPAVAVERRLTTRCPVPRRWSSRGSRRSATRAGRGTRCST